MSDDDYHLTKWGIQNCILDTLDPIVYNIAKNDIDGVFVAVGPEGLGKSTLLGKIGLYCAAQLTHLLGGEEKQYFWADKVSVSALEYATSVYKEENLMTIQMYDEAATGWYARRAASGSNINLNMMLMTCRNRRNIHLISIPNFFALDPDVRFRRVTGVFSVYGSAKPIASPGYGREGMTWELNRGHFDYYAGDDIKKIWQDPITRLTHWPPAQFNNLEFTGFKADDAFWVDYLAKSFLNKADIGKTIIENLTPKVKDGKKGKRGRPRKPRVEEDESEDP